MISKITSKKALTLLTLILGLSFIGLPSATMASAAAKQPGPGKACAEKCHDQAQSAATGKKKAAYEECHKSCPK